MMLQAVPLQKFREAEPEQRLEALTFHSVSVESQLQQRTSIGGNDITLRRENRDTFVEGTDKFRLEVKTDDNVIGEFRRKHLILYDLCRQTHQCHRMLLMTSIISGYIQRTQNRPPRVEDGGSGTAEKTVLVNEMLTAVY